MSFTRAAAILTLLLAVLGTASCSSAGHPAKTTAGSATTSTASSSSATGSTATGSTATGSAATASAPQYYVSLGDSYAAGYQPTGKGTGSTTRNGFAYQLVTDAKAKGYRLSLRNFGCAGATTTSVLTAPGCSAPNLGPGAADYAPQTQAAAAEAFLRAHAGQVALVTVSIGGNDITACAKQPDPTSCLISALGVVKTNLTKLLSGLRAATGPRTPIVGITYPDVLLSGYLSPQASTKALAQLSVTAFKSLVNPALQGVYSAAGARFVDVTAATGAYGSMTSTTPVPGVGQVPTPVAKICQLTFSCEYPDIHPRTAGYALIAKLIFATLPTR